MDISSRAQFAADPAAVHAMMIDPEYLTEVCRASDASDYDVSVQGDHTRSERSLPAPPAAAKFTGSTIRIVEEVDWKEPAADGSRVGDITVSVPGQPVKMTGTVTSTGSGDGTVVTLDADFKVNIPLLGKKLEQSAAPALIEGFNLHQSVGNRWLAEH